MDAVLNVKSSELNEELLKKLKGLIKGSEDFDITIHVTNDPKSKFFRKETREEYFTRLKKSIEDVKHRRNMVEFTLEQFDAFGEALLRTNSK